ncbi:MAG: Rossmann-like and DUF2520 domain-containing protein [Bacteroidales bacterium]|jgi:predicted short-subunit dehydrogenase-like oxidoreductase (DUF2520 family)
MNKSVDSYNIGFFGAGKVGTSLAVYFKNCKLKVNGFYNRTLEKAKVACELSNTKVYYNIKELILENDIIFLTVSDDSISAVLKLIIENESNSILKYKIFIHTSGVHSSAILKDLNNYDAEYCSMHPLLAINNYKIAVDNLAETFFCLDGTPKATEISSLLLKFTNNKFFCIESDKKPLYHGAACVISNYLVTLADFSFKMFEEAGLDRNTSKQAIKPLIQSTLDNILKSEKIESALTGPIKRGDIKTVKKHLLSLEAEMPEFVDFYKFLGRQTVKMINKTDIELNNILK